MLQNQSRLKDPLWYKDAIIYELRVGSFYDSNGDGIGDFKGLTQKIDYLQDLGVTAVWLLPFYPSPFKDDGYDISDYFNVHHQYGTIDDFKEFIDAAHAVGIHVITELVLNHTSDQHEWFQRARLAPAGSDLRNFYVWSDTPNKYRGVRIIFKDSEQSNWTWDPVAKAYYWHRFYHHQPDLNYDHPTLKNAILEVVDFWLGLGVDGMRLDGIPYLVEREGTSCDNLPETHQVIKELRAHMDEKFTNCVLLAEANQWPVDSIDYFGTGDECHMAFHFPIMPRLFMSIQLEDCFPLVDIINQTPKIPDNAQWALFLRNHDELTLEMVTDEERDFMYRTYANDPQARLNLGIRRRLAPLLGNDRRKIELMNAMLFSLAGTPFVYYADEIGMGDNIYLGDRNGVRTPMQWNIDRNAGFSKASSQRLCFPITMDPAYSYETVNVETQQKNPNSLLWWMKRLIALRKRFKAFGRGTLQFLATKNPKIIAFVRKYEDEEILVVANFSRSIQFTELDLSEFNGGILHELFGRTHFPKIDENPYFFTLAPFSFYWFGIHYEKLLGLQFPSSKVSLPDLEVQEHFSEVFEPPARKILEKYLLHYLKRQSWLQNKDTYFRVVTIDELMPLKIEGETAYLTTVSIADDRGFQDTYLLPLMVLNDHKEFCPIGIRTGFIADLKFQSQSKIYKQTMIYDGFFDERIYQELFKIFYLKEKVVGLKGSLKANFVTKQSIDESFEKLVVNKVTHSRFGYIDVVINERFFLKIFRYVEHAINPEVEVEVNLTRQKFKYSAKTYGTLDYTASSQPFNLMLVQSNISEQRSAWDYTIDETDRYFERIRTKFHLNPNLEVDTPALSKIRQGPSKNAQELIGYYLEWARMLAEVTANMHLTLSTIFTPKEPTPFYLRSNFQSKRNLVYKICNQLADLSLTASEVDQQLMKQIIAKKEQIIQIFEPLLHPKEEFLRIRGHGDYHLGQLFFTGKDFIIVDFAKGIYKSFDERKRARSALRDVAGMIRSFHLAIFTSFLQQEQKGLIDIAKFPSSHVWPTYWQSWVAGVFVREYRRYVDKASFVPQDSNNFIISLQAYLLETAIEDLFEEIHLKRDQWFNISLRWVLAIIEHYPKITSLF